MMRNIQTREGFEFCDKLNALPRYAFLLSPSGKSVQKFEDQAMGNWIDVHEAHKIVDQAQDLISELQDELERQKRYVQINGDSAKGKHAEGQRYRDERDALQQRLTAADQKIDEQRVALIRIRDRADAFAEDERDMQVASVEVIRDIAARALGEVESPDQFRDVVKMIAERNPAPDFSLIGIVHTPPAEYDEP